MFNQNPLLQNFVGFYDAMDRKQAKQDIGHDFSQDAGKTQHQIEKLHPARLALEVTHVIDETPSTKTLRLKRLDGDLPPFQAGQYINLFVEINGVLTARPYAISSCPSQRDFYDLTIKIVKSGFVSPYLLETAKPGHVFYSTGPMGSFHYNPIVHGKKIVFIAGGSGGAPARSMIESMINLNQDLDFHLIYGNSFEDDVIFRDYFRLLEKQYSQFHLTEVISRPTASYNGLEGYLNASLLKKVLGTLDDRMFFICGPTPFNEFVKSHLKILGVEDKRIRIECNGPPKEPSKLPEWPSFISEDKQVKVTVKGRGELLANAGEPLLNSLERNGYTHENACRSGECSLCRVKILEGDVVNAPDSAIRKSDRQFGWVHACVAYPMTDVTILY